MQKKVPVLITWDVDPDSYIRSELRRRTVDQALDLCQQVGVRSTFFITAKVDHLSPRQMERLGEHEVGCHGLTHWIDEEYNRMPVAMQRTYIEEATRRLEEMFATPIKSFRSPRVKTSGQTLKLLSDYGYMVDSSVCSQRIDFISSNMINPGWIVAPRRPYHPHRDSAFKRGDLPIWEVPVSAMVLPFISASMRAFGLAFMKMFFRLLYAESRRSGKPIVYLAHTTEFVATSKPHIKLRHFSPSFIRTHGFLPRNALYRMDGKACLKATGELLTHMASYPDVAFMTVSQYANQYLRAKPLHDDEQAMQTDCLAEERCLVTERGSF